MTFDPSEFDVIVIGGGLAGHCAALAAAEDGAAVLLLEKERRTGGSTALSGGLFALANTPFQRRRGIADSPDLLYSDLRAVGGHANDPALLRAYVDGQHKLHDWLVERGVTFPALELSAGQSVPRSHQTDIGRVLELLGARAAATGFVTLRTNLAARRLLRDGNEGPVTGVLTDAGAIAAHGGVVLATGGFSRSEGLLREFAPNQARALRMGGAGNVGDGLRMAWRLGAGLRDMSFIKGTFGTHPETRSERHEILLGFYMGAIVVNRLGRRFIDESAAYKLLGDACLEQPDAIGFQIFDQKIMDRSDPDVPLFNLAPALERGLMLRADTAEALSRLCGIDAATFAETLQRYNAAVDAGHDPEYGRDGLCNHAGALVRIDQPPFYAYPSTSVVLATYCGLTVTPEAEVLDVFAERIDGLYAAGEITGGFHGTAYMTGTSLGKAALFGRIAGRNAALRAAPLRQSRMFVGRNP
jgi:fumarate reductase flavoprotein subunit